MSTGKHIDWSLYDDRLIEMYKTETAATISRVLRLPEGTIRTRVNKLQISKSRSTKKLVPQKGEVFKPISGFTNFKISNHGRILNLKTGRELKQWVGKEHGYSCSMLCENNVRKNVRVHILVAKAFISNDAGKTTVNHKDGVKTNNLHSNLEWSNMSEQMLHAHSNGLQVNLKGTSSKLSKVTDEQVIAIARAIKKGLNSTAIKQQVDLSNLKSPNSLISRIRNKQAYTDLTNTIL